MTVSVLFAVGRLLFVVPFVLLGVDRVLDDGSSPGARVWAAGGLVGAAAVALGAWGDVAALVVGLATVGIGVQEDGDDRLRLVGLLGGALCIAALYAAVGAALDLTLTDPVLDLDLR